MRAFITLAAFICTASAFSLRGDGGSDSRCPQYPVVTAIGGGRTANCIWEYVTTFMVAKYLPQKHVPYTQKFILDLLQNVFEGLSLPPVEDIPKDCKYTSGVDWYTPNFFDIFKMIPLTSVEKRYQNYTDNMVINMCVIFVEPVYKHIKEVKQEMKYKQEFVDNAQETFRRIKEDYLTKHSFDSYSKITLVGVHVRRTDYIAYLSKYENRSSIGAEYFKLAFQYFRNREEKFGRPLFLVVSDDGDWVMENLVADDVYLVSRGGVDTPGFDLALLSLCDHAIIDYGTYGLFAALYTEGEVISVLYKGDQVHRIMSKVPTWHLVDTSKPVLEIP